MAVIGRNNLHSIATCQNLLLFLHLVRKGVSAPALHQSPQTCANLQAPGPWLLQAWWQAPGPWVLQAPGPWPWLLQALVAPNGANIVELLGNVVGKRSLNLF